jgi:hypothetical protein
MVDYTELAERLPEDSNQRKIFEIISTSPSFNMISDSPEPSSHSTADIQEIQRLMYEDVKSGLIEDGTYRSLDMIKDSWFNNVSGIGTGIDPSSYNTADIPVSLMPMEATAYYASGGIAQTIIDKKSYGLLMNGYKFEGTGWTDDECAQIKEHADSKGFDRGLGDALRDGNIYGGGLLIPWFKGDTAITYRMTVDQLISKGIIAKDCIDYFWTADRWNSVLVPDYNISAKNYLMPDEFYIPIAGLGVRSERMAVLKPKKLPYWGTIRQMGWGISEMEGWINSLLGYEIMAESISTMFQQLSLMYHQIDLDGMLAQNGVDAVKAFADFNSREMANWSSVNPRTINSVGEIKVISRQYAGLMDLVTVKRQDLSAKSGIPESSLFHTQPGGVMNDNKDDITLKEAGVIQKVGNNIIPQLQNLVKILVYSTFGPDSEQAKKADTLRISFDSPTVITDTENSDLGTKFFGMLTNGVNAGLPIDMAVSIASKFVPSLEIDKADIDRLAEQPLPEMPEPSSEESPMTEFTNPSPSQSEPSAASDFVNQPKQTPASNFVNQDQVKKNPILSFFDKLRGK